MRAGPIRSGVLQPKRKEAGKMINKIKALGLAMVAVFAMSAVAASAASAHEFTSSVDNTTLMGEATTPQVFNTTVGELECSAVSLDEANSTIEGTTAETVTARPEYSGCVKAGTSTKIYPEFGECGYVFTSETTEELAEVEIECPNEGEEVEIKATGFKLGCVNVPPQPVTGVHYIDATTGTGTGDIDVVANVSGIEYNEKGVCGSGHGEEGTYTGTVTVQGTDANENLIEIMSGGE
jgi:hypothetical protein